MDNSSAKVNGIAHIALSVSNIVESKIFYKLLLPFLGLKLVHESFKSMYYIGGKTAILIQQIKDMKKKQVFSQNNVGLHHFCFRAVSKEVIDILGRKLLEMNVNIIRGPLYGDWVPGYYYILFEDPDKIRIEVNFVPNKGVFTEGINFNPSNDY